MFATFPCLVLVKRDLIRSLRKKRFLGLFCLFAVGCLIAVISNWPGTVTMGDLGLLATYSQRLFCDLSMTILIGCMILTPGVAATAIATERENDTFDTLRLTLIRPSGLLFGKGVNVIGIMTLFFIGALPMIGATLFLPGLETTQVLGVVGLIVTTTLSCAMIGLFCSVWCRNGFLALLYAYAGAAFFLGGGVLLLSAVIGMLTPFHGGWLLELFFTLICPPTSLVYLMEIGDVFSEFYVYHGILISAFGLLGMILLHRSSEGVATPDPKVIDDPKALRERKVRFPFYLIDPLRRKPAIEDGRNPMMVRELGWGAMNRGAYLIRIFYSTFAIQATVAGAWMLSAGLWTWDLSQLLMVQVAITLAPMPVLLGNGFAAERRGENFDDVRMTLLGPRAVVSGKFVAAFVTISPLLLAFFVVDLIHLLLIPQDIPVHLSGWALLLATTFLVLNVSFLSSLLTRNTAMAITASYLANGMLLAGNTLGAAFAYLWFFSIASGHCFAAAICFLTPFFAFGFAVGRDWGFHEFGAQAGVYLGCHFFLLAGLAFLLGKAIVLLYGRRMADG